MGVGTRLLIMVLAIDLFLFVGTDLSKSFAINTLGKFGMTLDQNGKITVAEETAKTIIQSWLSSIFELSVGAIVGYLLGGVVGLVSASLVMGLFGDFIFAPVKLMQLTNMPWQLTLIVGGIWSVLFIMACLDWVRGVEY